MEQNLNNMEKRLIYEGLTLLEQKYTEVLNVEHIYRRGCVFTLKQKMQNEKEKGG